MLNPIAVFKLQEDSEVEVLEDGENYTVSYVSASEYSYYETSSEHAGLERLGADSGYEVWIGDAKVIIPEEAVREIISVDDL